MTTITQISGPPEDGDLIRAGLREKINARHGFVLEDDMPGLVKHARLLPLLVRCGGCRFTAPAQDVAWLIKAVEDAGDYVRDVSLPRPRHWGLRYDLEHK